MLTILDEHMERVIEPVRFRAMAGSSAADIQPQGKFNVQ
jgi:hypothetical protein